MKMSMRWPALVLLCLPTACVWVAQFGPSQADAQAIAAPHCTQPVVSLPPVIDRDVRGVRLTGHWNEANISPFLFGDTAYEFVEWEPHAVRPGGARLMRYTPARPPPLSHSAQACPNGSTDLGPYVRTAARQVQTVRACATTQIVVEPTTRWQIRRTLEHSRHGSFQRLTMTHEIVDALNGIVLGPVRHVMVTTHRDSSHTLMIGIFPALDSQPYQAGTFCGRALSSEDILRLLQPTLRHDKTR